MRELLAVLKAWDVEAESTVQLKPGLSVEVRGVHREPFHSSGTDPYQVHFNCGGRSYSCPLFRFQARARSAQEEFAKAV